MAPPTHDTLIIIPAWNEADVLGGVLQEVRDTVGSFADLVVVSDGSTDATSDIARSAGVPVLDLSINLGVGGAMALLHDGDEPAEVYRVCAGPEQRTRRSTGRTPRERTADMA